MLHVPVIYLKDKQVFTKDGAAMRLVGKPIDIAKELKGEGCKLIHIIDLDAMAGTTKNFDIYDALTYIINVQVECAPDLGMVRKLLSVKCRVVIPASSAHLFAGIKEKKLLVAKLGDGTGKPDLPDVFGDVLLESAAIGLMAGLLKSGKRILIYEKDKGLLGKGVEGKVWASLFSYPDLAR